MSIFERFTRRGASTAPPADDGVIFRTSLSAHGRTPNTPLLGLSHLHVESAALGGFADGKTNHVHLAARSPSSKDAKKSGRGSRLIQFVTRTSRSTGGSGRTRRGKKPQTGKAFLRELDLETREVQKELRSSLNRQLWGDQLWLATTTPSVGRRLRLKLHRGHKGEWIHHPEHWYYEDCECCGQPVKGGWHEYWARTCAICGKFETRDKIPTTQKGRFRWLRGRN